MKIPLSILLIFSSYSLAWACSCIEPTDKSKAEALQNASVIFSGKVISTGLPDKDYNIKIRFQVLRAWKGVETKEIFITTPSQDSLCGYSFRKDETYTVYGTGNPPSTTICLMMQVDESRVRKVFGEGKNAEDLAPAQPKTKESVWFWLKILSLFS